MLLAMVFPTLVTWIYFVLLVEQARWIQQVAFGVGKAIQFAFPLVWVLAVQRERLRWRRPTTAGLLEGVGFGVLVVAGVLLVYHGWLKPSGSLDAAGQAIRKRVVGLGVDTPLGFLALGTFYSLGHSFLEEYYWRWFVFGRLRRLVRPGPAIALSSLGFTAHHVLVLATYFGWWSVATVLFSLAVAAGGAVWAWIYDRSGSLYGPWLSHLLVDAAVFAVGYDLAGNLFG